MNPKNRVTETRVVARSNATDLLDGLLLGDASLTFPTGNSNSNLMLAQRHSSAEWIDYMAVQLTKLGFRCHVYSTKIYYALTTRVDPFITEQERRWYFHYGEKRIKRAPHNLVLTPGVVLNWFLGDGSSSWSTWRKKEPNPRLTLCTNGFSYDEVYDLCNKMNDLGISTTISRVGKGQYMLYITRMEAVQKFYDYIGPSPVRCFDYKWKAVPEYDRVNVRAEGLLMDIKFVISELRKMEKELGHFPTIKDLQTRDVGLYYGINRYHGGYKGIMDAVFPASGYEPRRKEGLLMNREYVISQLKAIANTMSGPLRIAHVEKVDPALRHAVYEYHGGYSKLKTEVI